MTRKKPEDEETLTRRQFVKGTLATVALTVGCGDPITMLTDAGRDAGADGATPPTDATTADDAGTDAGIEPVEPPESVTESLIDFPLGVASGDVTASSAILWTSYAGSEPVELVVWEMDGDTYARTVHAAPVTFTEGFAHEDVTALAGGLRYRYAFFTGARATRSPIGRFRAALAADALAPLTIGAVSCTSNSRALGPLGHAAGRDDLDVFLYLGDTTYNDGAVTLADYRGEWGGQMARDEYRALRAKTSALATWDDHEFDNDWNPETIDADQRTAAVQTFFEHQPLRRDATSPDRVWKKMSWGRTADLFVLDTRSERVPSTRGDADLYVSRAQMDWLKTELSASPAVFKLILNSVPISDFPGAFDLAQNDRWEGYPTQREEILRHIDDEALTGVLWIAGDFHLASAQRVDTTGPGATQREILVGPGAQSGNPLAFSLTGDQFDFASTTNNYTVLELLPAMTRVRASWIDASGAAFEVHELNLG